MLLGVMVAGVVKEVMATIRRERNRGVAAGNDYINLYYFCD